MVLQDELNRYLRELNRRISQLESQSSAPNLAERQIDKIRALLLPEVAAALAVVDVPAEMSTIERGARAEYLRLASQHLGSTAISAVLFAFSIWIIALVIKVQTMAVIDAAGWDSVRDLLLH